MTERKLPDPTVNFNGEMAAFAAIVFIGFVIVPRRWQPAYWKWTFGISAVDSVLKLASLRADMTETVFHAFWVVVGVVIIKHFSREKVPA